MKFDTLQADYNAHEAPARAFLSEFLHQFLPLIQKSGVKLGVPLEGRVKEWSSVSEKLDRKEIRLDSCKDLADFIGVRAITLFSRDADTLCRLVETTFPIRAKEDKAQVLDQGHFGYLSKHFVVTLPRAWKEVPTFSGLDYCVEIQVRTLSQHIWAAASHLLQYKKESDVPRAVGRSIHRVAALLETVDLEFERVLQERHDYTQSPKATASATPLDADNIKLILDESLPSANKSGDEVYSDLLTDLATFDISTVEGLRTLIKEHLRGAMDDENKQLESRRGHKKPLGTTLERMAKGVFYTHVGLTRQLLADKYGKKWDSYNSNRSAKIMDRGK
jgi:putative GTP pyrophosphokinase